MKKINILSLIITLSMGFSANAQKIIDSESIVKFTLENRGSEVTGTLGGMKGDVIFDRENLDKSSFNVTMDANTINTANGKRDAHLKNEDFFETETYATISFVSTKIEKKGDKYIAIGSLSMHGISKDVAILFNTIEEKGRQNLHGNFVLDHADYGIGKNREVSITITCVVSK
jgi:polyisoprenoid-binding protein YceI